MRIFKAVLLLCLVTASRTPVKAGPLAAGGRPALKFIGEGGSYLPPSPEQNDAMEYGSWQQPGLWETVGSIGDAPKPQNNVAPRPGPTSYVPVVQPQTQDSPSALEGAKSKPSWPFAQQRPRPRSRPFSPTAPADERMTA